MALLKKTQKDIASLIFIEYRCSCGKLLFKGLLLSSALEIKCKRCSKISIIGGASEAAENDSGYSMLFDDATTIIDISPSAIKILGFSLEELRSMSAPKMNFLFRINTYNNLWLTAKRLNFESFTFETIHLKKSGELIPVRAEVRFIKNSAKVFALVTFQSLQTQSEQLEDQESQTQIATNSHSELVSEVNALGIYSYMNRALATLAGFAPEECLGQSMFNFYLPEQRDRLEEIFFRRLKQKQSFKILPHTMVCKNGEILRLESYFTTHFNDRAELRGFRIISWPLPK